MRTNQRGRRSAAGRPIDGPDGSSLVSGAPAVTRLAWALTALSALLLLLAVVLLVLNRDLGVRALTPHLVVVPGFAVVGLVLAVRRPGHAIGSARRFEVRRNLVGGHRIEQRLGKHALGTPHSATRPPAPIHDRLSLTVHLCHVAYCGRPVGR